MKYLWYLTITIILFTTGLADVNSQLVSEMDSVVYVSGTIDVSGPIEQIDLNLTIPQNTTYQTVRCNTSTLTYKGVKIAHLHYSYPPREIKYNVVCHVHTNAQITKELPNSYSNSEYMEYTEPSEGVPSDNPDLRALAENITAGEVDDFQKLAKLMQWVHDYIVYDESYAGKYLDTMSILKYRRGVCVEYSTLFVALARSLGYPARFVGGIAYGDHGPTGHMWVEVYLGKWVPFDPTWDLGGSMDATHIPFYKTKERKFDSRIRYSGTGGNVQWYSQGAGGEYFSSGIGSIHIENMIESNPPVNAEIINPAKVVNFNSGTFVGLNLTTDRFLIIPITLTPCTGDVKVVDIEDPTKVVIIEPGKSKLVYWGVKTMNLDPRYIYTCGLTVNSGLLPLKTINVKVSKTNPPVLEVAISNREPKLGDDIYAYINSNQDTMVYGVYDDQYDLDSGMNTLLQFKANHIGNKTLMITTSKGGLWEYNINTVLGSDIEITSVKYPKTMIVNETGKIEVTVEDKANKAVQVTIDVFDGEKKQSQVSEITGKKMFTFPLKFSTKGMRTVSISVTGGGSQDRRTFVVNVVEKPTINANISVGNSGLVDIELNERGAPTNVRVYIDDSEYVYTARIQKRLPPGEHRLVVTWEDPVGNTYRVEKEIVVPQYINYTDTVTLVFIAALAIAVGLLILAFYMYLHMPRRVE